MVRSVTRVWLSLLLLALILPLAASPAAAELFHIKLRNGAEIDTLYKPQQSSWDANLVLVLSDTGNWIGLNQKEIDSVESDSAIRGFGVALDNKTIAIGWAPNDLPEPTQQPAAGSLADQMQAQLLQQIYQQQQAQQHYTVPQGVSTDQTQGVPLSAIGGSYGGNYGATGRTPVPSLPTIPATIMPTPSPAPGGPAIVNGAPAPQQ